jgi:hypothetical protein
MSAEDKKPGHAPNGNGVVRTGKRPFIIGVSGGTASGKVRSPPPCEFGRGF